jgi:thiol:disulfide interchange protein DsbD
MSFLLFGTVVYLLYILSGVLGGNSAVWAMAMLTGLGLAAWLYGRFIGLKRYGLLIALAAALIVGAASVAWFAPLALKKQVVSVEMHDGWEDFSLAKLEQYTAEGRNVLVDFTADWCPNCKYNEQTALNIESTMALKEELDFTFLYADWTQKDDEIGNVLRSLGFASVPLTAVFPGDNPNAPILLDGVFTPGQLHEAMRKAAGGT